MNETASFVVEFKVVPSCCAKDGRAAADSAPPDFQVSLIRTSRCPPHNLDKTEIKRFTAAKTKRYIT